jgi:hypothetical protein
MEKIKENNFTHFLFTIFIKFESELWTLYDLQYDLVYCYVIICYLVDTMQIQNKYVICL